MEDRLVMLESPPADERCVSDSASPCRRPTVSTLPIGARRHTGAQNEVTCHSVPGTAMPGGLDRSLGKPSRGQIDPSSPGIGMEIAMGRTAKASGREPY
jgi:hypothetical protein